jgi:hypothetical protein
LKAAVDNTFLTLLLNPRATPRPNPATNESVTHCRQRIESLIDEISTKNGTLYIPAPALAEVLCVGEAIESYFEQLQTFACIELAPFDGKAAYELGKLLRDAISRGDKRSGQSGNWQHVKMDRMIVAVALSNKVDLFLSDDQSQINFAKSVGLTVKSTWDLALSPDYSQQHLSERDLGPWPEQKKPPKPTGFEPQLQE